MTTTTVFYDMTSARAERITADPEGTDRDWVAFRLYDDGLASRVTVVVRTIGQADELIKAGVAALDMLTQDGAPPPAECGPGACTCGRTVDHNGGVHEAGETP